MPLSTFESAVLERRTIDLHTPEILVVIDDLMLTHRLNVCLKGKGYNLSRAYNGWMAWRMAQTQNYDLIILDVHKSYLNGFKVYDQLRAMERTAKIPVIFVTGETSYKVDPLLAGAGRVAYVKKPLDMDSFDSLVKAMLQRFPSR